jgi:hypothetical protein
MSNGFVSLFADPSATSEIDAEKAERERCAKLASLDFLRELFRDPEQPMRLRYMAASDVAAYENVKFKAVARLSPGEDAASAIEAARLRAKSVAMKVISVQKALPATHPASELQPAPSSAENNGGFRRRF